MSLGIKLVIIMIFLRSLGFGFIDPYYSIYLSQFTANYTIVGILSGMLGLASLIALVPLTRLMDRVQDNQIMEDGEIFQTLSMVIYILAGVFKNIPILILALILHGVAQQFIIVGAESFIRRHSPASSERNFAYYNALNYGGWILGMFISAFIINYLNLNILFLFLIPSSVAGIILLRRTRDRGLSSLISGILKYFHNTRDVQAMVSDIKTLNPRTPYFLLLAFSDGMIRMYIMIFVPLFGISIGLSLPKIAIMMAAIHIPFVFSHIINRFAGRFRQMNLISIGLLIGGISLVLLALIVHEVWIAVLLALNSLTLATIYPAYNGLLTRLTPIRQLGEVTGVVNFVFRLGQIAGPVIMGLIADLYGIKFSFYTLALFFFGLSILSWFLRGYDDLILEDDNNHIAEQNHEGDMTNILPAQNSGNKILNAGSSQKAHKTLTKI
jgi:MFS family permease